MPDAPPTAHLERLRAEIAGEATRASARAWWQQGKRLEETSIDPAARWEFLMTALRRVGWPE